MKLGTLPKEYIIDFTDCSASDVEFVMKHLGYKDFTIHSRQPDGTAARYIRYMHVLNYEIIRSWALYIPVYKHYIPVIPYNEYIYDKETT